MSESDNKGDWKKEALERRREKIQKLKAETDLPAPWEAHPEIPCFSIGWRMGPGEDFLSDWYAWTKGLKAERFEQYCRKHIPPPSWTDWFASVSARIRRELTSLEWDEYWDSKLKDFEAWLAGFPN